MYASHFKRPLDVAAAAVLLVALAPLLLVGFALAALAVRGNPVFLHRRPGRGARPFHLIKLRTMLPERAPDGRALSNVERLTPLGAWLRRTSIDELPQLLNVLKGDLSLVGPRPLEMRYLPHYSEAQRRRHEVRPGITGLAQVNGRNALSWEERFRHDVAYVDALSFGLDCRILWRTLGRVLGGADVNQRPDQTMDPFA